MSGFSGCSRMLRGVGGCSRIVRAWVGIPDL